MLFISEGKCCHYDLDRTKFLESLGLKVIRFDNLQIFNELESVLAVIYDAVELRI